MTMSSCGQLRCDVVYQFVYTTVWCRISLPLSRARERKAVYKVGVSTVRVAFLLSPRRPEMGLFTFEFSVRFVAVLLSGLFVLSLPHAFAVVAGTWT